jgi:hypothetical protein
VTQVLHEFILWHDHGNVSAIYCPYATHEFRVESKVIQPRMHCFKIWVPRFNDVLR